LGFLWKQSLRLEDLLIPFFGYKSSQLLSSGVGVEKVGVGFGISGIEFCS
jgi:hypothetical protein